MTPTEFRTRWGTQDELLKLQEAVLTNLKLPSDSKKFLIEAGLPAEAAPFLDFGPLGGKRLESIAESYGLGAEFNRYVLIGSDAEGNPICLDQADAGAVVRLNHEDQFKATKINPAISLFAEALLAYRQLVRETLRRNGDDAFLDGNIPEDLRQRLEDELRRIDPTSLDSGSFWAIELQTIDANRQHWESASKGNI
jgi:SUKH-4 immunity protein